MAIRLRMKTNSMPGRVIDLSIPGIAIPDPIVVDTNMLVERLIVPFFGSLTAEMSEEAARVDGFFQDLVQTNGTGLVTPTVYNEFVHVAIKFRYRQELLDRGVNPNAWTRLYKREPSILRSFGTTLDYLRRLMIANGLLMVAPEDLGPVRAERRFDEELINLVRTYGLDSHDALILMETRRMGISEIVTLDSDMIRASPDFNIYTWM